MLFVSHLRQLLSVGCLVHDLCKQDVLVTSRQAINNHNIGTERKKKADLISKATAGDRMCLKLVLHQARSCQNQEGHRSPMEHSLVGCLFWLQPRVLQHLKG